MLCALIQSVNSVNKPCYIDQPNLALFLNRVKPGIALTETMLFGDPLYTWVISNQHLLLRMNILNRTEAKPDKSIGAIPYLKKILDRKIQNDS